MGHLAGNSFNIKVLWGSHHAWPAGREYSGPCYATALWLVIKGEAEVWSGQQCWRVGSGDAFLWPKDRTRRVVTLETTSWFSLGVEATTPSQVDVLSLLPLPALRHLDDAQGRFLHSWLQDLVTIREKLTHATPENERVARYFESVDELAALPSYDQWINQVVAERSSHLDVIEEGLARSIVGWCWGLWGTMDFESALHHQSPPWLQRTLDAIRKEPRISVQDLSKATGFSPAQFRRLFHQEMGQSPRDYLQRQRLEFARHLLETTALSIAEVARKTGFTSVSHFVQVWKQTGGLSPLQYRLSRKASNI